MKVEFNNNKNIIFIVSLLTINKDNFENHLIIVMYF